MRRKSLVKKTVPPKQRRAKQTVADIVEATAQVLEASNGAEVTTNRVAERAGVSIGTLYRYFSDKQSIFRRMAEAELSRFEVDIAATLDALPDGPPEALIRAYVGAFVGAMNRRFRARRRLIRHLLGEEALMARGFALHLRASEALETRLAALDPARYRRLSSAERSAFCGAVGGALRAPMMVQTPEFDPEAWEEIMADFVERLLRK